VVDPRDQRSDKDYFEIIGNDEGIFGCMGLLACEDVCPKNLPLQNQLGFLRRKMGITAIKEIFGK
jgi:fumarate reductase iron-sulfur subunit